MWCMSGVPRVFYALVMSLFVWCMSGAPRVFVTGFAKRGLIHTSDFATLMSHKFV